MRFDARAPLRRLARGTCLLGAVLALAVVAGCGSDSSEGAGGEAAKDGGSLSMGFLYDIGSANAWTTDECLSNKGIKLDGKSFTQFADVQRALQSGEVDIAVMGPQNLGQMVDGGFTAFKAIAGVDTGGEHITLGKGVEVNSWKDFAGKKVGIPPNSFVDMLFRAGATEGGLNMDDVEVVSFPGAGPAMLSALESGAIDVMVAWETNNAQAKAMGIGDYSPVVDLQQGKIGNQTSVMYATDGAIANKRTAVQAMVDCLVEQTKKLSADVDAWKAVAQEKTGVKPEVADIAVDQVAMDYKLYQDSVEQVIKTFAEHGLIKDSSDQVGELIDWSFLEKATGKPKAALSR